MSKKILIVILGLVVAFSAHGAAKPAPHDFSYLFHLYFDNDQLYADRDFQFKYDIIGEPYGQPTLNTQFPYRGEIINMLGEVADHFVFDPKQGDIKFTKGKISVRAPYVADGEKAVFYDIQNQPILTIFISDSSFCNDDAICNADRGEDSLSCPKDCKQSLPAPPVSSPAPSAEDTSSGIMASVIYIIVGILAVIAVWWFFRRRNAQAPMVLPAIPPSSQPNSMPTPPPPPNQQNKL